MRGTRVRAVSVLASLFLLLGQAQAQEAAATLPDGMERMAQEVLGDPEIGARYRICPADLYDGARGWIASLFGGPRTPWVPDMCADRIGQCRSQCRDGDGAACFDLALMMQRQEDDGLLEGQASERLFSEACNGGDPSGCTNRAAALGNEDTGDAFTQASAQDTESCAYRSFDLACAQDDPWGCTMLGMFRFAGTGTPVDPVGAEAALARACFGSDGTGEPCDAARSIRAHFLDNR